MARTTVGFGDALSVLSIDVLDKKGMKIGAINQISPTFNRPNTRVRDLDSDARGDVKDLVPGVENITISVNGFALRSNTTARHTILNRVAEGTQSTDITGQPLLASQFLSLKDNNTPFDIAIKQTNQKTGDQYTLIFVNCLLNNFSYSITMTGDVVISESASIDVSSVAEG